MSPDHARRSLDVLVASPDQMNRLLLEDMFRLCDSRNSYRFWHAPTGDYVLAYLRMPHRKPLSIPVEMDRYYPLILIRHDINFGPDRRPEKRVYPKLSSGDDLAKRVHDASYGAVLVGMGPPRSFGDNVDYRLDYPPSFEDVKKLLSTLSRNHPHLIRH